MICPTKPLAGSEYVRLGRGLELPQPELERIENSQHSPGEKTRQVLSSWLERRGGPETPGTPSGTTSGTTSGTPPVRQLELALRAMDKDIRLFTRELALPASCLVLTLQSLKPSCLREGTGVDRNSRRCVWGGGGDCT